MVYRDARRALIDAAVEVIACRGVEAATTREIYLRAGVKAPTLYHHFGDKKGLLDAVVTDAFDRYLARKRALPHTGDAAAVIRQGWDLHAGFARASPSLYQLMWPPGRADLPAAAAESAKALREGFARLEGRGALRPGVTPAHAARVLSAALSGVTAMIIRDPDDPGNDSLSATVGRSDERLRAAGERIESTVPGADLVLERADLAELAQVRDLAGRLLDRPHPDAVISNAALVTPLDRMTSDGLPRVLAVNHLAPYLLLRTLSVALDRARLIVVGADPVSGGRRPVDLDDLTFAHPERLGDPAELRPFFAYGRTKTMNATFVFELARRLAGTAVTVNCVHPGIIRGTGLSREVPGLGALVRQAFRDGVLPPPGPQPRGQGVPRRTGAADGRPGPDVAADTPAWLATAAEADGVTGRFFFDREPVRTAAHTSDPARCERLWKDSARLTGLSA